MIDNELKTIIKEYIYSEIDSSNEINGFSSNLSCMKSMIWQKLYRMSI